jgi:hypothetical protein
MHLVPLTHRPFERIGIDLAGPFNVPGQPGYLVVCAVDHFSKYVRFWAFRRVRAADIIRIVRDIITDHGAVDTIVTGNASISGQSIWQLS